MEILIFLSGTIFLHASHFIYTMSRKKIIKDTTLLYYNNYLLVIQEKAKMSSFQVLKPSEFNTDDVGFSSLKKNNNNAGKSVFINLADNKRVLMQFPAMKAPFGFSTFTDDATGKVSYSLPLSFDRNSPEASELKEKLSALDDKVIKTVETNSKDWLGKKYNAVVMRDALYKFIVSQPKEE